MFASPPTSPIVSGESPSVAEHVDEEDREHDVAEEVRRAGARGDAAQVRVAQDVAQALGDLGAHAGRRSVVPSSPWRSGGWLRLADAGR